jgi:uncharacterized protein
MSVLKQQPPKRYKIMVITWLGVFPTITFLLSFLEPWLKNLPLVLRTLVLTVVMVPLLTYVVMPCLNKLLYPWLFRK